jgi:photosystem II stability/assembly factor-like uncharacterized protein
LASRILDTYPCRAAAGRVTVGSGFSRVSRHILIPLLLAALPASMALGQQKNSMLMSVLNSRQHQWGKDDNPVIGIFSSSDAGVTWQHRGWREYIRTFYTESGPDGTLWSACGNGVLRSTDGGDSWRVTTGWDVTEVLKVKADPSNSRRVYATTAYGLITSTDRGETWRYRMQGVARRFTSDVCIDRKNPKNLLLATELGVFRSTSAGERWEPTGLSATDTRTIIQHPSHPRVFWAGTEDEGMWQSLDGGRTWKKSNVGIDHLTVYAIAIEQPEGPLYIGTHGGGVYRSSDNGATWQQCSRGMDILDVHTLAVHPGYPGTVFAGTLNGGLYQSTDHGESWRFNSQADAQVWGLWWGETK